LVSNLGETFCQPILFTLLRILKDFRLPLTGNFLCIEREKILNLQLFSPEAKSPGTSSIFRLVRESKPMATYVSCSLLKAIVGPLAVLMVFLTVLLGLPQAAAQADSTSSLVKAESHLTIALAASSRFAAQADPELQEPTISQERLEEMREQRREWQSEVSAEAYEAPEEEESVGEAVNDRLNLDEITESQKNRK
jgi:hypothetical protein